MYSCTVKPCKESLSEAYVLRHRLHWLQTFYVLFGEKYCVLNINLSKPTGHVMHQQFNIQQLYVLPTLHLCVLYLSENKQRLVPLTA